jgi:hypothetical protein
LSREEEEGEGVKFSMEVRMRSRAVTREGDPRSWLFQMLEGFSISDKKATSVISKEKGSAMGRAQIEEVEEGVHLRLDCCNTETPSNHIPMPSVEDKVEEKEDESEEGEDRSSFVREPAKWRE